MSDEYYPGKGCRCHAMSYYECACDGVDWTDPDVYRLRAENAALLAKFESAEQGYDNLLAIHGTVLEDIAALREDKARLIKALVDVADRVHTRYSGLKHETITAIDAAKKEAQP